MKVMENLETEELQYVEAVLYIVLMLHPGLKIMPFKLTGYCRMRSKDGKFKPRRRRMQNVWLYSAKWSYLNKDKRDCRTFQLIKQFAHSWRHLKTGLLIYNFIL